MAPDGDTPAIVRLREDLTPAHRVHLDAPVLARHLRGEGRAAALTGALFDVLAEEGGPAAQTSTFSLFQLMVEPYRQGHDGLVRQASSYLSAGPVTLVPLSEEVAVRSAEVRASLGTGPGRSVQIATALLAEADCYLTEGSSLRRIAEMRVLDLDGYVGRDVR